MLIDLWAIIRRGGRSQKLMKHELPAFILLSVISATKFYKSVFSPAVKCLYLLKEVNGSNLTSHISFLACSLNKTKTGSALIIRMIGDMSFSSTVFSVSLRHVVYKVYVGPFFTISM